jgi:chromosome segregation ATPase
LRKASFIALLALALVAGPQFAHAQEAPDQELPGVAENLHENADQLSIDNEMAEADEQAYEDLATSTTAESNTLKSEIRGLEQQVKSLQNGVERTKKKVILAQKRVDLQKEQKATATKKAALAEKIKEQTERRVAQLSSRASALEAQAQTARERTRSAQEALRTAEKENADLNRRVKKAQAVALNERKKRDALREKKARVSQKSRQLRNQLASSKD